MRALVQGALVGPGALVVGDGVEVPRAAAGEVLVKVGAAGVNFADVMQTRGAYDGGPEAPYVAGFEAAGEIVAVGDGVDPALLGARVIGTGPGAFAEYVVMGVDSLARVPAGWRDEQALGLVLNWGTALAALRPLGQLAAGQVVLVHAAAGAVGQAAVRLAKHYGATVIGTASAEKHDVVRRLGADELIDYRAADLVSEVRRLTGGRGVDVVLESVGGETFGKSLEVAKRVTGKVIVYGVAGGEASVSNWELNFKHQVHVIGLHIGVLGQHAPEMFAELMAELDKLIEIGVYPPGEPTVYDLADGPKVLAELEARATVGKLALKP
ncbi:NADPH:quinone oxidoreductase family protein [Kribbella sp. NPDC050820]|uniref:NADPH:quinone oxidoreductase family protein n=1 Tax=Kribbella sp. NPDC050820 TaxID=3155408 RepID=UPI0033CFD285